MAAALLCAALVAPCVAELRSNKPQEEAMALAAARASEKWRRAMGTRLRTNDSLQGRVAAVRAEFRGLEGGILADMNIDGDAALMFALDRPRALDLFDVAAANLCDEDQARYFSAKAALHTRRAAVSPIGDTLRYWLDRVVDDYAKAAARGYEARKALGILDDLARQPHFQYLVPFDRQCRIYQAHISWVIRQVGAHHTAGRRRDALALALGTVAEVTPSMSFKPGACNAEDPALLVEYYDTRVLFQLRKRLGTDAEAVLLEAAERYWDNKRLVALQLPRLKTPHSKAFKLFERAGEDPALRSSRNIAVAEFSMWKAAGKLAEYKQKYPQRYRMVVAGAKKSGTAAAKGGAKRK